MQNLIEQSKQKSTNFFTVINGVKVPNYESVRVEKIINGKKYYWYIERASEHHGGFRKHYICCEVSNGHLESSRARIYDNVNEFDKAIKRIEKKVN